MLGFKTHLGQKFVEALSFRSTEGFHDYPVNRPGVVLSVGHLLPCRQLETGTEESLASTRLRCSWRSEHKTSMLTY